MCQGQADANQPAICVVASNAVCPGDMRSRRGPWAQVKLLKLGAVLGLWGCWAQRRAWSHHVLFASHGQVHEKARMYATLGMQGSKPTSQLASYVAIVTCFSPGQAAVVLENHGTLAGTAVGLAGYGGKMLETAAFLTLALCTDKSNFWPADEQCTSQQFYLLHQASASQRDSCSHGCVNRLVKVAFVVVGAVVVAILWCLSWGWCWRWRRWRRRSFGFPLGVC